MSGRLLGMKQEVFDSLCASAGHIRCARTGDVVHVNLVGRGAVREQVPHLAPNVTERHA